MATSIVSKLFSRGTRVNSAFNGGFNGKDYIPLTRLFSSNCVDYSDHIAIDFGDANYHVAVMEGKNARIIDASSSAIAFNEKGESLFGTEARQMGVTHPGTMIYGISRLLGRKFDDPFTQKEMKRVSYNIVKGPDGDACVEVYGNVYHPCYIQTEILNNIKRNAESYIGKPVCNVIMSTPAHCNENEPESLKADAKTGPAGVHSMLSLYYGICPVIYSDLIKKEGLVAILDMGCRTFNASILETTNCSRIWKTKNYDLFLGGEDFDNALMEYIVSEFKKVQAIDLTNDRVAIERIRVAAEKAKMELSYLSETEVNLPYITSAASRVKHLNIIITRSTFEKLVDDLIKKVESACESCLKKAGISSNDVDEVLLVGGTSRVPKVQMTVTEIFGRSPHRVKNPDEAIALGAAAIIEVGVFPKNVWKQIEEVYDKANEQGGSSC